MPLSEHVYCVEVTFKMTVQVQQRICIKFCVKLEYSSMETVWMIHEATAMGNWWLAGSSLQCAYSCVMSCAGFFFFCKTSSHPGDSAPLQSRFGTLQLLVFPKTTSPLKGKRFQTVSEIQENTTSSWWQLGELWGPKLSTLKGTKVSLSCEQCFLYLLFSSISVSIFHITWLDTFWTDLLYQKWNFYNYNWDA